MLTASEINAFMAKVAKETYLQKLQEELENRAIIAERLDLTKPKE